MEIPLQKEEYRFLEKCESVIDECIQAELSLPEYMPEIVRIIKSCADVRINSCGCTGERCTVDGECELRMIYTCEDGLLYSFSQTRPFSRYCENRAFAKAEDVNASAEVSYVSCRAVNPRRAEMKAGVAIHVTAYSSGAKSVASSSDSAQIQQKCRSFGAMSLGCRRTKGFSMSDVCRLGKDSAQYLIGINASAMLREVKKIGSKLMLTGEAVTEICYVPTADKSLTEHIRHTMPINQVLEFEGLQENFTGETELCIAACDVIIKNSSDGEGTAFDISLGINASVTMWEEKRYSVITDAYSVSGELSVQRETAEFLSPVDEIHENRSFRETLDLSKTGVSRLLDMSFGKTSAEARVNGDCLTVSGTLKTVLLYRDRSGEAVILEKAVDYSYERKLPRSVDSPFVLPGVTVCSVDCIQKSDTQAEIRLDVLLDCRVFSRNQLEIITGMSLDEAAPGQSKSALTIYFTDGEESLWDIARAHNTTVQALAEENGLSGETTGQLKMLLIPTV